MPAFISLLPAVVNLTLFGAGLQKEGKRDGAVGLRHLEICKQYFIIHSYGSLEEQNVERNVDLGGLFTKVQ